MTRPRKPAPTAAYQRFLGSMKLSMDDWRDGIGYDTAALAEITDEEKAAAAEVLAEQLSNHGDWRDIEALDALATEEARRLIRAASEHTNYEVRLRASETIQGWGEDAGMEDQIIAALRGSRLYGGLSQALDLAEDHPTERIKVTLRELALNSDDREARVLCAGLALFLGGKAGEAFDWDHRPFFLKFGEEDRETRVAAYKELCERLGVPADLAN